MVGAGIINRHQSMPKRLMQEFDLFDMNKNADFELFNNLSDIESAFSKCNRFCNQPVL